MNDYEHLKDNVDALLHEKDKLECEAAEIGLKLIQTLPMHKYVQLKTHKKELGIKVQKLNMMLRDAKKDRQETLAQAFMNTVIEMFDPTDVSEVWDRLYVNYPHLPRR